jgi:hypothetical protein
MTISQPEPKKVTFRKNGGKSHKGLVWPEGWMSVACSCPGSANGSLKNGARIICDGWEKSNCGN